MSRPIDVVGAVVIRDGLVLCAQRGPGGSQSGLWEFPGGKIEAGESPRAALAREVLEELTCVVEIGDEITTTTHRYDVGTVSLTTFYCRLVAGTPRPTEHASIRWLPPDQLDTIAWAPADMPAVLRVQADLGAARPGPFVPAVPAARPAVPPARPAVPAVPAVPPAQPAVPAVPAAPLREAALSTSRRWLDGYPSGMGKKQWSDLSTTQQRAVIVGGGAEVVVTALAACDLVRRSSAQVRGPKAGWLMSFVVQPFGPLAYFAVGRRPTD